MHDMRELIPPDAPKEVKIQLLARLHDQVMGEEIASRTHPSAALQLGVTSRVAANLKQVGGPRTKAFSSDPTAVRSALIMSSAPVKPTKLHGGSTVQLLEFTKIRCQRTWSKGKASSRTATSTDLFVDQQSFH